MDSKNYESLFPINIENVKTPTYILFQKTFFCLSIVCSKCGIEYDNKYLKKNQLKC